MVKNTNNKSKNSSKSKSIKQTFLFLKSVTLTAAKTVEIISLDSTDLPGYSGSLTYFLDMYRFFRITRAKVSVVTEGVEMTSSNGVLTFVPEGATAPASFASVESPYTSEHAVFGLGDGHYSVAHLTLPSQALTAVVGNGGWLVSAGDATDPFLESYGSVQLVIDANQTGAFSARVELVMEFKGLVDPLSLSRTNAIRTEQAITSALTHPGIPRPGNLSNRRTLKREDKNCNQN